MFGGVLNTPLLKNKAGVGCVKRNLVASQKNVNVRDIYFEILQ